MWRGLQRPWRRKGRFPIPWKEAAPVNLKRILFHRPRMTCLNETYYSEAIAGPHFAPMYGPTHCPRLRGGPTPSISTPTPMHAALMRIFALALELPEQFFDDKIDNQHQHVSAACATHERKDGMKTASCALARTKGFFFPIWVFLSAGSLTGF